MYSTSFNKTTTFLNQIFQLVVNILSPISYVCFITELCFINLLKKMLLFRYYYHSFAIYMCFVKAKKNRYIIASFLYNLDRKVSNLIKLLWELFLFHFGQRKFFIRATVQGYEKLTMIMMSSSLFLHGLKRKS